MLTRVERVRKAAAAVMRRKILEDDRMPPFPGSPDYRQLLAVHSTRNGVPLEDRQRDGTAPPVEEPPADVSRETPEAPPEEPPPQAARRRR